MAVTLKDEKILETWGYVLQEAQDNVDHIFENVQNRLEQSQAPGVRWGMIDAQPGRIKGFFGKKRDYLLIQNDGLKEYRLYINAREYGLNLDISWFLTAEPSFFKGLVKEAVTGNPLSYLDVFDRQDLRAYVTIAHHSVVDTVKELMEQLGQDPSLLNTQSKGALEIW